MNIDQLELQIIANSTEVSKSIDKLTVSLQSLDKIAKSCSGLQKFNACLSQLNTSSVQAAKSKLGSLVETLQKFKGISVPNLKNVTDPIEKIPQILKSVDDETFGKFTGRLKEMMETTAQYAPQLAQFSTSIETMKSMMDQADGSVQSTTVTLTTLENETAKADEKMKKLGSTAKTVDSSFTSLSSSFRRFSTFILGGIVLPRYLSNFLTESNEYIENLNLFNASMRQYANEATNYMTQVQNIMGIDPAQWMKQQGTIMTMAAGYGVAADRAYIMSKNLTQLGYDLASFYNLSYDDAFSKIESGLSGELKPLRRLGYDLSKARLEAVALSLGIDKTFASMTQAEKAELRYYAIMTQVTVAQGDMARTLETPANQLRILSSQFDILCREIGNVFIPILNKLLPYLIATAKVLREVTEIVAKLFGYTLPEIDYSSLEDYSAEGLADELDDADEAAQKLQRTLFGFDQINKLNDTFGSGSGDLEDLTGGFDFELPEYDFLGDAIATKLEEVTKKIREWFDLDKEINNFWDLMDTRLARFIGMFVAIKSIPSLLNLGKTIGQIASSKVATNVARLGTGLTLLATGFLGAVDGGKKLAKVLTGGSGSLASAVTETAISIVGSAAGGALIGFNLGGGWGALVGGLVGAVGSLITAYVSCKNEQEELFKKMVETEAFDVQGQLFKDVTEEVENYLKALDFDKISEWNQKIADSQEAYENAWDAYDILWRGINENTISSENISELASAFEALASAATALNNAKIDSVIEGLASAIKTNITSELTSQIEDLTDKLSVARAMLGNKISGITAEYQKVIDEVLASAENNGGVPMVTDAQRAKLEDYRNQLVQFTLGGDSVLNSLKAKGDVVAENIGRQINAGGSLSEVTGNIDSFIAGFSDYKTDLATQYYNDYETISRLIKLDETEYGGALGFSNEDLDTLKSSYLSRESSLRDVYKDVVMRIMDTYRQNINSKLSSAYNTLASGFMSYAKKNGYLESPAWRDEVLEGYNFLKSGYIPQDSLASGYTVMYGGESLKTIQELNALLNELNDYSINAYKTIGAFASGGFPNTGELYLARENGSELIGRIGSKNAVANNDQIIEGIKRGVKEAMQGSGGGNWTIQIVEDGRITGTKVVTAAERQNRRDGRSVIKLGV